MSGLCETGTRSAWLRSQPWTMGRSAAAMARAGSTGSGKPRSRRRRLQAAVCNIRRVAAESASRVIAVRGGGSLFRTKARRRLQANTSVRGESGPPPPPSGASDVGSAIRTWFGLPILRRMHHSVHGGPDSPRTEILRSIAAGLSSEGECLTAERAAMTRLADSAATRRMLCTQSKAASPLRVFPEPVNPLGPLPRRIGIVGGGNLGAALACRLARSGHEALVQERSSIEAEARARRIAIQLADCNCAAATSRPLPRSTHSEPFGRRPSGLAFKTPISSSRRRPRSGDQVQPVPRIGRAGSTAGDPGPAQARRSASNRFNLKCRVPAGSRACTCRI